jgi:hypothetical protein
MSPFVRGRRWFSAGSIATLVVALLHTLGNMLPAEPTDEAYVTLMTAMRGYRVPLGLGMVPSVWDIHRSLVFTMSVCLAAMGAIGLTVAASRDVTPRLLSRLAVVLTIASAVLTALYAVYQITPALISLAVMTILFAIASFRSGSGSTLSPKA